MEVFARTNSSSIWSSGIHWWHPHLPTQTHDESQRHPYSQSSSFVLDSIRPVRSELSQINLLPLHLVGRSKIKDVMRRVANPCSAIHREVLRSRDHGDARFQQSHQEIRPVSHRIYKRTQGYRWLAWRHKLPHYRKWPGSSSIDRALRQTRSIHHHQW